MKNTVLLAILALGIPACMSAESLTADQALARYRSNLPRRISSSSSMPTSSLKLQSTIGNMYVFSGEKGFVLLPNEDSAPVMLGYSDSGKFDIEGNPALKEWLDFYNKELEYLKDHPEKATEVQVAHKTRDEIAPLLKMEWNQEYPYNLLCPKVDGKETVTGCVATAMAQVMKYHNYPEHGKGTHSYYWRPGEEELTFDYESTPFQWSLMEDIYNKDSSEESRHAVAELMLGCGVSVDMHYEPGESGAATTAMGASLIDIFGYSSSLWMPNRAYYGYDEWEDMIYADLAQCLPVLYSGAGTAGGHQFVCDGYKSDGFFHFNWGWGGLSNGYFLLTALNPDDLGVGGGAGGFNSSQVATLGVRPAKGDEKPVYIFYNTSSFLPDVKEVKAGDDFRCTGQYFNFSLATMPEGSRLGMKFVSEDNGEVKYVEGPGVGGFHPDDGRNDLQVRFPELSDGRYKITPALHVDDEWSAVRMPLGMPGMITAIVTDGTARFESEAPASIYVSDIIVPSDIYRDHDFPMTFVVENTGDEEFYSTVTPMLLDSNGDVVSKSVFRPVDVLTGEKEDVSDYIGRFSAEKGETFAAGEYSLVFRDEAGKTVSDPIAVNIKVNNDKTEIKVTEFKIASTEPITDPSLVEVDLKVTCEAGVYFGSPRFIVFPGEGGYEVYNRSSSPVYLTPGESKDVTITADMSHLEDGWYMALIYNDGEAVTDRIHFHIQRETSGVDGVQQTSETTEIYDLNGIRQPHPSSQGIYIINGKKVIIRY